jgi:hypothetical protein
MDLGKAFVAVVTVPAKVGLAVADAGLDITNSALTLAQKAMQDAGLQTSPAVSRLLGLDALERANRIAALLNDDTPLGRALARDGVVERLMRPGGPIDRLTEPGGALDRLTVEDGPLDRALEPGGLIDRLLADDGLLERLLAEEGFAERLLAEGGILDTLTAHNGPLEQLTFIADTLNRLTPGLEALGPTTERLRDVVDALSSMAGPLTSFTDRLPLRPRSRRFSTPRAVPSERIISPEDDER